MHSTGVAQKCASPCPHMGSAQSHTVGADTRAAQLQPHPALRSRPERLKVAFGMQLPTPTGSALRALPYAAARADARALPNDGATTFGISRHPVVKVVNPLQHPGYIATSRGRDGGFTLARPSHQTRVGELIRKVEDLLSERRWVARLTSISPPPRRARMSPLSKEGGLS